jgi:predicted O-methyltransferase YrrM
MSGHIVKGGAVLADMIQSTAYRLAPRVAARLEGGRWLRKQAALLSDQCARARSFEEQVEAVAACRYFRSTQKRKEIVGLMRLVQDLKPRRLCEIGASGGGTLLLLCQSTPTDARLLSIDLAYTNAQLHAYPAFARAQQQVTCLAADSHARSTLETVERWLNGDRLDFLFIDGDHSLAGVRADHEMYAPLVRPGGWIGFHDIVPDFKTRFGCATRADVGEVPAYWQDVKRRHPSCRELIEGPNQDGFGIGLLRQVG